MKRCARCEERIFPLDALAEVVTEDQPDDSIVIHQDCYQEGDEIA